MKRKKSIFSFLIFIIFFFIFGYIFIFKPIKEVKAKGEKLLVLAKNLKTTFSKNDIDLLQNKLESFSNQYQDFEKSAKKLFWLSFVPYGADFKNTVLAGEYLIKAAKEAVLAVSPYADLIGFKKGEINFVSLSAEERLSTAILTLDKMLEKIDHIANDISLAKNYLDKINPNRYPKKYKEKINLIKNQFDGIFSLFVDAKPLIKKLPEIFGKDKEKTYLVLFQNDKERRATGGFLTFYAIFKIKDGKIKVSESNDIYSLDETISHPKAPPEILAYHKDVYKFFLRDSNLSPDVPTSVLLFESLYKKSSKKVNYDGIIFIDTKVLVDFLQIFGDTQVSGINFSAKIDKRCDCPQVIYTLFDIVDRPTPYLKENRKGILGELMYTLLYKALGFSPGKYWGILAQTMFDNLKQKHVLLYFTDPSLQQAAEKVNFSGKIVDFSGDYLHVNNVNFAGAKSNMFVKEKITSKTFFEGEKIRREVVLEYRNPYPHSDCNLERGGLCLNATLRNWLRVYVPKGSTLINFSGSEKEVKVYEDLGKTVFEGFFRVYPLGKAKVIISYYLPKTIKKENYRLLLQKQPGTKDQQLMVVIENKKMYEGIFDTDKEIKLEE
jgi:hypothetical protein